MDGERVLRRLATRYYTRKKAITQRWPKRATHEAAPFAFPSNG